MTLVWFILDAVEELDLSRFLRRYDRTTGKGPLTHLR